MPSPEQRGVRDPEQESVPYYQAARFAGEETAGRGYFEIQRAILKPECDLSAFRVRLRLSSLPHGELLWHVVVLGELPPDELESKIRNILSAGEPTSLPAEVLKLLQERRAQSTKNGPWSEGHYRPGRRL